VRDFLKSGELMAEEVLALGTSILFRMTKQTPNMEFSRLKNPISMEIAINSITPGSTASHTESLKFLYGSDSTSMVLSLRKLTAIKLGHGIVQLYGLILSSHFL
jgi:hypothetical protein